MFLVVTVFFNKSWYLQIQYDLLKKYFPYEFDYLVIDNAQNERERESLKELNFHIIPSQPYTLTEQEDKDYRRLSFSHGKALNTIDEYWKKNKEKYKALLILDSDLFPVRPIKDIPLSKGYYGITREDHKYIWAGFTIFTREFIGNNTLNFSPVYIGNKFHDTGAYNSILGFMKNTDLSTLPDRKDSKIIMYDPSITTRKSTNISELMLDSWFHITDVSNRRNRKVKVKRKFVGRILTAALEGKYNKAKRLIYSKVIEGKEYW